MKPDDSGRFLFRPVEEGDLPGIRRLVSSLQDTLTTLPNDEAYLEGKVHLSLRSFYPKVKTPGGEQYFFVLEDRRSKSPVGTSAIVARIGGFDPFYTYQIRPEPLRHRPLGIDRELEVLHLKITHKGPSELCSLYLEKDYRRGGLGRLLSQARLIFMNAFPERFDPEVLAEIRGYVDENGQSPFWEAVGRPFFQKEFLIADFLSGMGNKDFIKDLMPRHPIYVELLPASVRAVIGKAHPHSVPALVMLEREGFHRTDEVDIFDAGPILRARLRELASLRSIQRLPVAAEPPREARPCLVAVPSLAFRATLAWAEIAPDGVRLDAQTKACLPATPAAMVDVLPLGNAGAD
ncbi:MAG: arginine N-succinyltransferase [Puniceicoccaceae bacterium]|nr:MAG: arginine N-succinyltransferase [Puniceicoccaceae bacterium]